VRVIGGLAIALSLAAAGTAHAQVPPTNPARVSEVHFEPAEPGLSLLMRTGQLPVERVTVFRRGWWQSRGYVRVYAPICNGPCAVSLTAGLYDLALSKGGGPPVAARGTIDMEGPLALHGQYVDRSAFRTAGVIVGVAGDVGGVLMIVASARCGDTSGYCSARNALDGPLLVGGISALVASTVVAAVLLTQRDFASLAVAPLTLSPPVSKSESTSFDSASRAEGAALTLQF
jgi:hypothetical protein